MTPSTAYGSRDAPLPSERVCKRKAHGEACSSKRGRESGGRNKTRRSSMGERRARRWTAAIDAIDAATRQARQQHHTSAASMFRKFTKEDHIKSASAVRRPTSAPSEHSFWSSIRRSSRSWRTSSKKDSLIVCKCQNYLQVLLDPKGEFIFFQCRQGPYIPTLRFLHKCTPRAAAFKETP